MGSHTKIDLALNKTLEVFKVENGGRPDKRKLIVLVTDGRQTRDKRYPWTEPVVVADRIRKKMDPHFLVIGVGSHVNNTELKLIAEPKGVYRHVEDFDELSSEEFVKKLSKELCPPPPTVPPPTPPAPRPCPSLFELKRCCMKNFGKILYQNQLYPTK